MLEKTNVSIASLNLTGYACVDDESLSRLANVPGISALKKLSLMCGGKMGAGLKELCHALTAKNKELEEISIYGQFDPSSFEDLINLLHNKKIKKLDYSTSHESHAGNNKCTQSLFNNLKENSLVDIETLEIGSLSYNDQSNQALEKLIESKPNIRRLSMEMMPNDLIPLCIKPETQAKILKHNFPNTPYDLLGIKNLIQKQGFKETSETLERSVSVASAEIA